MSLIIRVASPDDVDQVADLHTASRYATYHHMLPPGTLEAIDPVLHRVELRERFAREATTHRLTVAESGSAIVGFSYVGPGDEPTVPELHKIHVVPHVKGSGVGKALMVAALRYFADSGAHRAYLWVIEGNDRAIRFYEKGGWVREGTVREQALGTAPTIQFRYEYDLTHQRN